VFLKIHHAIVDGMAAVHLMRELHTSTPENAAPAEGPRTVIADRDPSGIELFARGIENNLKQTVRFARLSAKVGTRLLAAGRDHLPQIARGDLLEIAAEARDLLPATAPHTRFSEPVSPHRVMEAFGMPLSRIKRIRSKVPGSTLNDIFVAVAGGAARKYLDGKGELPDESLTALMPACRYACAPTSATRSSACRPCTARPSRPRRAARRWGSTCSRTCSTCCRHSPPTRPCSSWSCAA
jgi:hypothetical protein